MWVWVPAGVVCLALLVCLGLCIPLGAVIDADTAARRHATVHMVWFFGLCRRRVYPAGGGRASRGRPRPRAKAVRALLLNRHRRRRLTRLARDIICRVRVERMEVQVRFGLGSALATGAVHGVFCGLRPLIRLPAQYSLDVSPCYEGRTFSGRAHCVLKVVPMRLLMPLAAFLLSSTGRYVARMALFPSRA